MPDLTEKQQRFAEEYLVDFNATQAAIRAGYSEKTAYSLGQRLLKKVEIQEALQKGKQEMAESTKITREMVIKELASVGFSNISDYASFDPGKVNLKYSDNIDREKLAAISSVEESQTGVKLKLHNKLSALEQLTKLLGFDKESVDDNTADDGFIDALENKAGDLEW